MAEDADVANNNNNNNGKPSSGRSRFLSKSKWGKVFKEDDAPPAPGKVNSFKLNEDVVDFLKPSTDRVASVKPKINIAVAQRWPNAHEVQRATPVAAAPPGGTTLGEEGGGRTPGNGWTKPRRREGLAVGFAKAAPEVIGEGGDEAPEPPSEVGRRRSMVARSVSDRRPHAAHSRAPWPGAPRAADADADEAFAPQPLRRVQTSHDEVSAPLQRKHASPPMHDVLPHRPSLGRTPTGLGSLEDGEDGQGSSPLDDDADDRHRGFRSAVRPTVQTQFDDGAPRSPQDSAPTRSTLAPRAQPGRPSPIPVSPSVRRQRDMAANEGMVLRRVSALYMEDDDDQDPKHSAGLHLSNDFYNALSQMSADSTVNDLSLEPPRSPAHSRRGPSPSADPRTTKRRSDEMAAGRVPEQTPQSGLASSYAQLLDEPSPFADPKYPKGRPCREAAPPISLPSPTAFQPQRQPRPPDLSPDSARSPQSASPFTDPKYIKRHSGGATAAPPHPDRARPVESSWQPRPPPYTAAPAMPIVQPAEDIPATVTGPAAALPSYVEAVQMPSGSAPSNWPLSVPATVQGQSRSPVPDRAYDSQDAGRGWSNSRGNASPQMRRLANPSSQSASAQRSQAYSGSPTTASPHSSLLNPGRGSGSTASSIVRGPSPAENFSASRAAQPSPARSPAALSRPEDVARSSPTAPTRSESLASSPLAPTTQSDPAADLALSDFAGRVAHMKGVFRLTAEKERPADRCSPEAWLRAALWWYMRGKAGLEALLQQRSKSREPPREFLTQPHVDLAKAWWIISEPLEQYDKSEGASPRSARPALSPVEMLQQSVTLLRSYLKSLSLSMQRNQLMPPQQSLIQGQNTTIWLEYPPFRGDAADALGGRLGKFLIGETPARMTPPLEAISLGDTRETFCYGRFMVDVSTNTDDAETDRVIFPCILTMLRGRWDYQSTIFVASQSEQVNLKIEPKQSHAKVLTWGDVSWKASSQCIIVHFPAGLDFTVRMHERDFRSLWNLVEYSRKVEHSFRMEPNEKLAHEAHLAELQYADPSGTSSFPSEKVRNCTALLFERTVEHADGSGVRKVHQGHRLLIATDPAHKSLGCVSHEVGRLTPLFFEFLTDAAAKGTTAMLIRVQDGGRQCKILLVFPDMASRQAFYDVLNGLNVGPDETIVGRMTVTGINIQAASQHTESVSPVSHPALQGLQWQKLGVTNSESEDDNTRIPPTVESESLRIVARHAAGCITDRLNLGKGELLLRLPCADTPVPCIQLLREPQYDFTMSLDTRASPQPVADGTAELMRLVQSQQTVRTFTFATPADLHAFQVAVTGFAVQYDGIASTFSILRRMMVVSIHHKWQASNVRLQIVTQSGVTQLLAFMEDFAHADAMCFQVKSTDTFESVKGDGKGKKWAVKMKDAKFSLPRQEKEEMDAVMKVRRRFVNLEGLEYAEEHDDITVGFDTEEDRNRFAQALPAATTVSRGITLKRRI